MSSTSSNIYPSFFYEDAVTAIDWLCNAFGFVKQVVVPGPDGTVMHAELSFGPGVIMVGTAKPDQGCLSPKGLAGITNGVSVYVENPDSHYAQALKAGAVVVRPIRDEEYGARGYQVKDPEGHLWYFGNYRPGAYWTSK